MTIKPLQKFLAHRVSEQNFSCKSFVVTLFGDLVSQHGDWIWLGSLIDAAKPFGYSERLIRTSVFRLVQDDWLQCRKSGRKSYYAFTDSANQTYTKAARRIYAGTSQPDDGHWLIVLPAFVEEEKSIAFKRQLRWLGFAPLASGAYAHPSIDQASLEETIKEQQLENSVIVFKSKLLQSGSQSAFKSLVEQRWQLDDLSEAYQRLIDDYAPFERDLSEEGNLSDADAFAARTLLIHEYRRILLKDHELPESMLPTRWPGKTANALVKRIYRALMKQSEAFICANFENIHGPLPKAKSDFFIRFIDSTVEASVPLVKL